MGDEDGEGGGGPTVLRDAAGGFLCFALFVSPTVLVAPDVAREYWLRGERVPHIARRSRRHHIVLLTGVQATPEDRVYALPPATDGKGGSRAARQGCAVHASGVTYELVVERWVCSSLGAYRLQLSTRADPRLNGLAVVAAGYGEGGDFVGMAISPSGFSGMLLCVPADLMAAHLRAITEAGIAEKPFTRLMPPIMLQRVSEGVSRHAAFGKLEGGFRSVDLRAELGLVTVMPCLDAPTGSLRVSGTREGDFPPLAYEPFLELGSFVFRSDRFGKVECVAEVSTDQDLAAMVDEVVFECSSRVLASVDGVRTPTFKALVAFFALASSSSRNSIILRWADDRIQEVVFDDDDDEAESFGRRVSARAFLWFPSAAASAALAAEGGALLPEATRAGRAASVESCIDPCLL